MLKFEQLSNKEWNIINGDNEPFLLRLGAYSVTNKFHIVANYVQLVAEKHGKPVSDCGIDTKGKSK